MTRGWIGVDLDGTLAQDGGLEQQSIIGPPVPAMVARVKKWLSAGEDVRIFTARVSPIGRTGWQVEEEIIDQTLAIQAWLYQHVGAYLPLTYQKDIFMKELWDDRAIQVVKNTGERVGEVQR